MELVQSTLELYITLYNSAPGKNQDGLDIQAIRNKFLGPSLRNKNEHLRSLVTSFISFVVEGHDLDQILQLRNGDGTAEPFYINLFKGCVLFESLLKANPTVELTHDIASGNLGQSISYLHKHLGFKNSPKIGGYDLPQLLNELLVANETIYESVRFTGLLRNTIGHNFGWKATLNSNQYQKLSIMVLLSNLHAIASLY